MNFRNKKSEPLDISLTPMIDVVFLLLIFFMVTTTFSKEKIIKIQLPKANAQEIDPKQKQVLTLTIDKAGQYFIDEKSLGERTSAALSKALSQYKGKGMSLMINADANAPVQAAISVLKVATDLGFTGISFVTEKEE